MTIRQFLIISIITTSALTGCHTGTGNFRMTAQDSFTRTGWYNSRIGLLPIIRLQKTPGKTVAWPGYFTDKLNRISNKMFRKKYSNHLNFYSSREILTLTKSEDLFSTLKHMSTVPADALSDCSTIASKLHFRYLIRIIYHGTTMKRNIGMEIMRTAFEDEKNSNSFKADKIKFKSYVSIQIFDAKKQKFVMEGTATGTSTSGGILEWLLPAFNWTSEDKAVIKAMKSLVQGLRWFQKPAVNKVRKVRKKDGYTTKNGIMYWNID